MLRVDERDWFKLSLMSEKADKPRLGTSQTNFGYSDWAVVDLPEIFMKSGTNCNAAAEIMSLIYSLDGAINLNSIPCFFAKFFVPMRLKLFLFQI